MVNMLNNGDYIVRGGGIARAKGCEAAFHNALYRLQCRRGSFPFLRNLGSRLWQLGRERPADRQAAAREFCAEALQGSGVSARNVCVRDEGRFLTVELELVRGDKYSHVEVNV